MTSGPLTQIEEDFYELEEVRLHVMSMGPQDGELVVLLHGFPGTGIHGDINCHFSHHLDIGS